MKVVTVILIITCFATCARRDMERIHYEVAKAKAYLEKKKQEQQSMEEAEALEVVQQETDEEKGKQEQQSMEEAETLEVVQQEKDEDQQKDTKENVELEMREVSDTAAAGREKECKTCVRKEKNCYRHVGVRNLHCMRKTEDECLKVVDSRDIQDVWCPTVLENLRLHRKDVAASRKKQKQIREAAAKGFRKQKAQHNVFHGSITEQDW